MKKSTQICFFYAMAMLYVTALAPSVFAVEPNAAQSNISQSKTFLDVYKSETCNCCEKWVSYAQAKGFQAAIHHPSDMNQIKNKYGIAAEYQSCHTAVSKQGYVFEGHVPAWAITQFLANPPKDAKGLAVPAMPVGSPGMEVGDKFTPFDVLLLKKDGKSEIYAHIPTIDKARQ
jgi:hypothetical protein